MQHHNVNTDTHTQYQWNQSSLMMIDINEEVSGGDDVDDEEDDDDDNDDNDAVTVMMIM